MTGTDVLMTIFAIAAATAWTFQFAVGFYQGFCIGICQAIAWSDVGLAIARMRRRR